MTKRKYCYEFTEYRQYRKYKLNFINKDYEKGTTKED